MEFWGKHLILDVANGDLEAVRSKEVIQNFVNELVKAIDMIAFGPTWIERFATHDATKSGISFVQMIETSNITGHFVDKDGSFYLDIFSCKDFDEEIVVELVEKYFGEDIVITNGMSFDRDAHKDTGLFDDKTENLTFETDKNTFKKAVLEALKGETIRCEAVIADIDVIVLQDIVGDDDGI